MTNEEIIQKFKSGEIAISCSTEEEAKEFVKWCNDNGITWLNSTMSGTEYELYLTDTCYMYHPVYGSLWITSKRDFEKCKNKIIACKEFMKGYKNRVTNLEKYYDELISCYKSPNCYWLEVIKKGNCHEMSCKKCGMDFVHWLNEEYKENKEPITKLTKVQYEILKCLSQDSLILISNNELIVHKDNLEFFLSKIGVQIIESDCDDKQIKIKDILEKCEVVE